MIRDIVDLPVDIYRIFICKYMSVCVCVIHFNDAQTAKVDRNRHGYHRQKRDRNTRKCHGYECIFIVHCNDATTSRDV